MPALPPIVHHVAKNQPTEVAALLDSGVAVQSSFPAATLQRTTGLFERKPGTWPLVVFAAKHAAKDTLKLLLERGATMPPEHLGHALHTFASLKDQPVAAELIKALIKASEVASAEAGCAMGLISAAGAFSRPVLEAMFDAGVSARGRDEEGRAVLNAMLGTSALSGLRYADTRLPIVELLISRGAPVDVVDRKGNLPLHYALQMGSHELALSLLRAGSPGVGRLTAANTEGLSTVVALARELKDSKGNAPRDLFALVDLQAWELLLELASLGMNLHVYNFNWAGKNAWKALRERAPLDVQLRSLPLIDDRDEMLRLVAGEAKDENGLARLKAALSLGWDLNLPDPGGEFAVTSVLGAALAADASTEVLELLQAHGAKVESLPGRWPLAISAAAHVSKLEWLASKGVALDEYSETWGTPLHRAVGLKADASVHFLLGRGARIDQVSPHGETPLSLARNKKASPELIAALTPPPSPPVDGATLEVTRAERSALSIACAKEDLAAVQRLLKDGANPDGHDERGTTPLAIAAVYGWVDGARLLLEAGAKPDTATRNGFLPFTTAHLSIQKVLELAGASIKSREVGRSRILRMRHKNLLERGDVRGVATAINEGMDVDLPLTDGALPLMVAIEHGHAAVVELLLRAGADPNLTHDTDETCVQRASSLEKPDLVALLVKAGATLPAPPEDTRAPAVQVPAFDRTEGKVAIFVNAGLVDSDDPDVWGDEEPPFWVDHDRFENIELKVGNLEALRALSYGDSFADEAIAAIKKLGIEVTHVFALYGSSARLSPGPLPDFWRDSLGLYVEKNPAYAGAFAYQKRR